LTLKKVQKDAENAILTMTDEETAAEKEKRLSEIETPYRQAFDDLDKQLSAKEKAEMQKLLQKQLSEIESPMGAAGGPVSGKGLKHTGLKTVKQIISRTENLIQTVNLGNKSKEVRNELDTLLAVLIDKKQIRPEFRSNLMKKLF